MGGSGLWSFMRIQTGCQLGGQGVCYGYLKARLDGRICLLAKVTHVTDSRRLQFLTTQAFPEDCLWRTNSTARASYVRVKESDQDRSHSVFYNLILEVTYPLLLPYTVGHKDQPWYSVEGDYEAVNNTRRWDHWGLSPCRLLYQDTIDWVTS